MPIKPQHLSFIKSFKRLLHKENAVSLFSLYKYLGDDYKSYIKITKDYANINLDLDDV